MAASPPLKDQSAFAFEHTKLAFDGINVVINWLP